MISKIFLLFFPFLFFASVVSAQKTVTLSGFVKDSLSGETLIGASVSLPMVSRGVTTNQYGFYSLVSDSGQAEVLVNFIGYGSRLLKLNLMRDLRMDLKLTPAGNTIQEVIVESTAGRKKESNVKGTQMGRVELSIGQIKQIPAFLGEVDILKTLQLMPGVRNAGEGNAGFYVRGGGPDQNLILLDDAVVYNSGHLFGFFSVFNSDIIKSMSLVKGGMPAQYGGRLSSVVDIAMKDGNINKFQGDAGIGLIASRLSLQGPIKKNKASFIIGGRRTYIDVLAKPALKPGSQFFGSGYYFYDLNAKLNWMVTPRDRIYASGYFGRDVFTFNNNEQSFRVNIPWGNSTGTLRWNHIFNKELFSNVSVIFNDYNFAFNGLQNDFNIQLKSGIRDIGVKSDLDWFASPRHRVKFGGQYTFHTFKPNVTSGSQDSVVFSPLNTNNKYAHEFAVYLQDEWEINSRLKLNAGLRYTAFQQVGRYTDFVTDANGNNTDSTIYGRGELVQQYGGPEPRINLRYTLNERSSLKAGITRNLQYIHLVTNSGSTLPTDLWVPSTLRVKPQAGWQYALGYFRNLKENMFETSVELYYKNMENQIEYREGYTPSLSDPEREFVFGKGWAYGAEFFVNKVKGRLTGWVGYTLSYTKRRFPDLNNGEWYYGRYDRRHDGSAVATYQLNPRWRISSVFVYGTGSAISLPERFYFVNGTLTQEYSRINAYRMQAYHRLDFSAIYDPKPRKERRLKGQWVFSIYNVYSRLNPYFYYFDQQGGPATGNLQVQAKKVSLFPIIPAVTWNIHWE